MSPLHLCEASYYYVFGLVECPIVAINTKANLIYAAPNHTKYQMYTKRHVLAIYVQSKGLCNRPCISPESLACVLG